MKLTTSGKWVEEEIAITSNTFHHELEKHGDKSKAVAMARIDYVRRIQHDTIEACAEEANNFHTRDFLPEHIPQAIAAEIRKLKNKEPKLAR